MEERSFFDSSINFWPPWADVLLTILLILILYIFIQYIAFSRAQIDELLNVRQKQALLESEIEKEFDGDYETDIKVSRDANLQRITFSDKILFDLGKADLKSEGKHVLYRIGLILKKNPFYDKIQIEGHTDDLPIISSRYAFPSNWELSSARATSVVRYLQENVGIAPKFLSATGYSEYQPVAVNRDDESRARNRRIEMVLVYTTLEDPSAERRR
jgi:flagellar motor protein MotB